MPRIVDTQYSFRAVTKVTKRMKEIFTRGLYGTHQAVIRDKINPLAQQYLRERIGGEYAGPGYERRAVSATITGRWVYGRSRASGRFTFGKNLTFQGGLIGTRFSAQQGFGYPREDVADRRTDKAWRAIEFGTPSVRMPRGHWESLSGDRQPTTRGGRVDRRYKASGYPIFVPHRGSRATLVGSGITAKNFIRDAVFKVADELPRDYEVVANDVERVFLSPG